MVKILKPEEKKNNVVVITNKEPDSIITNRIPDYMGYNRQRLPSFARVKTGGK